MYVEYFWPLMLQGNFEVIWCIDVSREHHISAVNTPKGIIVSTKLFIKVSRHNPLKRTIIEKYILEFNSI